MSDKNSSFIGHQENWLRISKERDDNRLPGAYLFYGPPGIGKSLFALNYVAKLFCRTEGGLLACGECESCVKVFENKHPDLVTVLPADKRKTISVDQCREVIQLMQLAPLEAPIKVVIFPNTGLLAKAGWNALLKTIEEPHENRLFILIASSLSRVLPTIRSRCRQLSFLPPQSSECTQLLLKRCDGKFSEQEIDKAMHLASGSIGLARQMLEQGVIEQVDLFSKLSTFSERVAASERLIKSDVSLPLFFQAYIRATLDDYLLSNDVRYLKKIDQIQIASQDIERNVNKSFVFENLHSF